MSSSVFFKKKLLEKKILQLKFVFNCKIQKLAPKLLTDFIVEKLDSSQTLLIDLN